MKMILTSKEIAISWKDDGTKFFLHKYSSYLTLVSFIQASLLNEERLTDLLLSDSDLWSLE